jgi:hypothetical protein
LPQPSGAAPDTVARTTTIVVHLIDVKIATARVPNAAQRERHQRFHVLRPERARSDAPLIYRVAWKGADGTGFESHLLRERSALLCARLQTAPDRLPAHGSSGSPRRQGGQNGHGRRFGRVMKKRFRDRCFAEHRAVRPHSCDFWAHGRISEHCSGSSCRRVDPLVLHAGDEAFDQAGWLFPPEST